MADAPPEEPQTAGELIRFWRNRRRLSQLELALAANVSTKHLSFVETGRSRPSRQLLVHLAQQLDLPMVQRNRLLLAGGFAPAYLEQPYDGELMRPLRESLRRLLDAHQPNCNAPLIHGLKRKAREDADARLGELVEEIETYLPDDLEPSPKTQPVIALTLRTRLGQLGLFTVIATLGAPLEVTAASLAIETFLPTDEESAAKLRALAEIEG